MSTPNVDPRCTTGTRRTTSSQGVRIDDCMPTISLRAPSLASVPHQCRIVSSTYYWNRYSAWDLVQQSDQASGVEHFSSRWKFHALRLSNEYASQPRAFSRCEPAVGCVLPNGQGKEVFRQTWILGTPGANHCSYSPCLMRWVVLRMARTSVATIEIGPVLLSAPIRANCPGHWSAMPEHPIKKKQLHHAQI